MEFKKGVFSLPTNFSTFVSCNQNRGSYSLKVGYVVLPKSGCADLYKREASCGDNFAPRSGRPCNIPVH